MSEKDPFAPSIGEDEEATEVAANTGMGDEMEMPEKPMVPPNHTDRAPGRFTIANLVGGDTDVSPLISMVAGFLITFVVIFLINLPVMRSIPVLGTYSEMLNRSANARFIQFAILWFFFWGLTIFAVKLIRFQGQKAVVSQNLVPAYLTRIRRGEAREMLDSIIRRVKYYESKVLARRLTEVLEHYLSGGSAKSSAEVARDRADLDAEILETSYSFLRVLIWGIPILGFIGTVLGISVAVRDFSGLIDQAQNVTAIKETLGGVTTGLAVAFETTLVALIAALVLMFFVSPMQKSEERLYNDVEHMVLTRLVSKLDRNGGSVLEAGESDGAPVSVAADLSPVTGQIATSMSEAVQRMADNSEAMQKTMDDNFQAFNHQFSDSFNTALAKLAQEMASRNDGAGFADSITKSLETSFEKLAETIPGSNKANLEAMQQTLKAEADTIENLTKGLGEAAARNQQVFEQLERGLSGYIKTFVAAMSKEEKIISLQNQINQNLALLTTADTMQKTLSQLNKELESIGPILREAAKPITVRILEERNR